jgi:hypothetical protein
MERQIRTAWILCFSILLCLLPAGGGAQEIVLCSGENGHLAIEAAGSGCCVEGSSSSSGENEPHANDHCGDCVDVPISIGLATISKDRGQASPIAPVSVASGLVASNSLNPSECLLLPELSVSPGPRPPLSSIILQI